MKKDDEFVIDFAKLKNLKKIKYEYLFLLLFIIFGFYLRTYHIDYPSIGYHNMKENEYIGSAKFMYHDGDYLHRRLYRMGNQNIPYFEEYPQIPLIQWASVIMWHIFGMGLWPIRLLMILASVFSIYAVYLLINKLTKNKILSLLSAFFMSILPLGIFFGRNIQPESPALFFLLLSMVYYARWTDKLDKKNAFFSALFLSIAGLFKYTFLIGAIPMFFIFPFSKFREKKFIKTLKKNLSSVLLGFLPLVLWTLIAPFLNKLSDVTQGTFSRINLLRIFSFEYWMQNWGSFNNYTGDNFTWWYFWFAVFGVMLLGLSLKDKKINYLSVIGILVALLSKFLKQGSFLFVLTFFIIFVIISVNAILSLQHKNKFHTFVFFYASAIIPYSMILADFIKGHNYYQMPFLPLIAILSAYFLYSLGSILKSFVPKNLKLIVQLLPLIIIIFTLPSIQAHKDAMFNTQFFGTDVAGQYLNQNMAQNQRFFLFGQSQSVAACVYAERLCIMTVGAEGINTFKGEEEKWNITWILIDAGSGGMNFLQSDPEIFNYVSENYNLNAMGGFVTKQGFSPRTFVLRKGGSVDFKNLSSEPIFQKQKQPLIQKYELSGRDLDYYFFS